MLAPQYNMVSDPFETGKSYILSVHTIDFTVCQSMCQIMYQTNLSRAARQCVRQFSENVSDISLRNCKK